MTEELVMNELERARALFENDLFATRRAGIVIEEVGELYAKCSMAITEEHRNAAGAVMGGAIFTLSDFTFAVAANIGGDLTVTTNANISFLGGCRGERLIAETRLLKDGGRCCFFEITVHDEYDNPVAIVTATGTHLGKKL